MPTPVPEINPIAAIPDTAATTHTTANSHAATPAAVPQDTVTISAQAAAAPNKATSAASPAQTTSASVTPTANVAQQILVLLSEGLSDSQIAEELNISLGTVQQYVASVQPAPANNAPAPTPAPAPEPVAAPATTKI